MDGEGAGTGVGDRDDLPTPFPGGSIGRQAGDPNGGLGGASESGDDRGLGGSGTVRIGRGGGRGPQGSGGGRGDGRTPGLSGAGSGERGNGSGGQPGGEADGQPGGDGGDPGGPTGSGAGGATARPGQVALELGQPGETGGSEFGTSGGPKGIKSPIDFGGMARPIELILACGPKGVAVHPGDYRVTKATMKAKDDLLVTQLRAIVRRREQADPEHSLHPQIRYVIEPGGHDTYAAARAQLALSGLGWPTSTQVSGGDVFRLFSTDDW